MLAANQKRSFKLLIITCFLALMAALIIAWNNPATGYELGIYKNTPILTWVFLILAMLGGVSIIIHQVVTRGYDTSRIWMMGLLLLVLSRFAFLYIPYIRGYVNWRGDNITHWGFLTDVLNTGHFSTVNFYPITHSLLSQTVIITGVPMQYITNLSTAFLSVFFIIATYLLATAVLPKRGQQLLATATAGVIMVGGSYNIFLMPNGWSILMIPLLFYFYFKKRSRPAYTLPFFLMLVMYPFFHPLSGLMIVMVFLAIIIIKQLSRIILKKRVELTSLGKSNDALLPVMIGLTILLPWILSFNRFRPNIRQMWSQIISGGPDVLATMGDTLSKIHVQGFDIIILFIKLYGVLAILIILSLIGLFLIVRQITKTDDNQKPLPALDIGIGFLFFGLLFLLYILGAPGMQSIGGNRMLAYTSLFTPVLGAVALYRTSQVIRFKYLCCTLLLIFLMILAGLSLMGSYSSPYNIQPNAQITRMDMAGMTWLINEKSTAVGHVTIMSPPSRFADGILGRIESIKRTDIRRNTVTFSDHFGYDEYATIGEEYSDDKYVGITKFDRIIYNTVWSIVDRFNKEDFEKLEEDPTVDRLYANGELNVYYIHGSETIE